MEALGAIALLLAGFAALYFGADWLVRGSVALALRLGIPPVIVGLTIVAFGTSSPELLVSFNAGRMGNADIAIGNVIGSNIANIALILGAAALIRPIVLNLRAVRFDVIFMLAVSILFTVMVLDRDLEQDVSMELLLIDERDLEHVTDRARAIAAELLRGAGMAHGREADLAATLLDVKAALDGSGRSASQAQFGRMRDMLRPFVEYDEEDTA